MKIQLALSAFTLLTVLQVGCSSAPKQNEYTADKVIGRSDSRSDRPEWVTETVSVREKGDDVEFIGASEVPGDSRVQAAFKLSDAAARGTVANKVETNVTKIVSASESGLSMDDQSLKSLIHEVSQVSLRNVDVKDRYWEKVVHTDSHAQQTVQMKVFSLIRLSKTNIEKLILEATGKSHTGNADMRNKVEDIVRSKFESGTFE